MSERTGDVCPSVVERAPLGLFAFSSCNHLEIRGWCLKSTRIQQRKTVCLSCQKDSSTDVAPKRSPVQRSHRLMSLFVSLFVDWFSFLILFSPVVLCWRRNSGPRAGSAKISEPHILSAFLLCLLPHPRNSTQGGSQAAGQAQARPNAFPSPPPHFLIFGFRVCPCTGKAKNPCFVFVCFSFNLTQALLTLRGGRVGRVISWTCGGDRYRRDHIWGHEVGWWGVRVLVQMPKVGQRHHLGGGHG